MTLLRLTGLVPLLALLWPHHPPETVMIVAGDVEGYVSPCGCVKPMKGGLRRLATAVKQFGGADPSTLTLYNGSLAGALGRQGELKAETVAEALGLMGVDAINLSANDARFGRGVIEAIHRLSGERLLASGLAPAESRWRSSARMAGWNVYGVSAQPDRLALLAEGEIARPILGASRTVVLWDGDEASARSFVKAANPAPSLVVFSRRGQPTATPLREGATQLVSPGEKGKQIVVLRWRGSELVATNVVDLGPEWKDDPAVSSAYKAYLARVTNEKLLDRIPRRASDPYIGTEACRSCHTEEYDIWKKSEHAGALATLEEDGHDRDPDCTSCHVVGLDKVTGFVSRAATPDLANVGCESCHGPGKEHALDPIIKKLPKLDVKSCMPCHNTEHSPGFEFETYWKRIQH